jgi:hypothetical protein
VQVDDRVLQFLHGSQLVATCRLAIRIAPDRGADGELGRALVESVLEGAFLRDCR